MIDHARALRVSTSLRAPKSLEKCDRVLLTKMKELREDTVRKELSRWLRPMEIKGLLARRDKIVAFFEKGGDARLYDYLPPQ